MSTRIPYTIMVPSHKRPANMPRILSLVPDALICVDKREEAVYRKVVPDKQLVLHPPLPTLSAIRNWMRDYVQTEAIIQINDDFVRVYSMVWPKRRVIVDPDAIRQILENGVNIGADLGQSLYCWSRVRMNGFYSNCKPFSFARLISGAFVLIGDKFRFDEELPYCADVDFALKILMGDRVMIQDTRFYFDLGSVDGQAGGFRTLQTDKGLVEGQRVTEATGLISISPSPTDQLKTRLTVAIACRREASPHVSRLSSQRLTWCGFRFATASSPHAWQNENK